MEEHEHCHGGKDGKHTWRFSNTWNLFYCTTPGCRATWDDQRDEEPGQTP